MNFIEFASVAVIFSLRIIFNQHKVVNVKMLTFKITTLFLIGVLIGINLIDKSNAECCLAPHVNVKFNFPVKLDFSTEIT